MVEVAFNTTDFLRRFCPYCPRIGCNSTDNLGNLWLGFGRDYDYLVLFSTPVGGTNGSFSGQAPKVRFIISDVGGDSFCVDHHGAGGYFGTKLERCPDAFPYPYLDFGHF